MTPKWVEMHAGWSIGPLQFFADQDNLEVDHQAWYLPYLRWSLHQGPSFKHRMKKKSLVATPTGSNSSEETTSKEAQSFWVSVFSSSILRT
ncbi:hypothetical protein WJX84_009866 [Apatococcus fuscideae]|uniref:Uncharacterized protein n=1 Tax=Apatococcus fuscideae TaxID=2026836 RepID=A0AAW1T6C8_9CHLO